MDALNPKARLVVDIMDFQDNVWTVRIHLYDETTRITQMSRWNVERIEGDPAKRGYVTVDKMGQVGDKVSIVLPEAIHDMGTNISVHSKWVDIIRRPIEQIIHETLNSEKGE